MKLTCSIVRALSELGLKLPIVFGIQRPFEKKKINS